MGKPTGFLEYERKTSGSLDPLERIKDFNEFHPALKEEDRKMQAARCMDCGVPFCQSCVQLEGAFSGCPLHNLIPEWNDLIYNGVYEHALSRLIKTASFPEFTGRVCPALCEAACTLGGLAGDSVTVRENELFLIEYAYENGLMQPRIPDDRSGKQVAVVGSGPAGLATADLLNRRGHSVTVFEKEDRIGGLLMYGIPNMKLEKSVIDRRVSLMEQEGVTFKTGVNVGRDITKEELLSKFDAVVLCCGAGNPRDLKVKGREECEGVYFAVDFLKANTKSLLNSNLTDGRNISAKDKNVIIVGGGDTGNDCLGTCIRHGAKSVIQIEMMPEPPKVRAENNPWPQWPKVLKTDYGQQEAIAVFGEDPRIYQTTIKEMIPDENGKIKEVMVVSLKPEKDPSTGRVRMVEVEGTEKVMACDLLLIACGFLGPESYIASSFGVETDGRSNLKAEEGKYATSVEKVFAAGDARRGQSLVVWAIAEGRGAAAAVDTYLMGYTSL